MTSTRLFTWDMGDKQAINQRLEVSLGHIITVQAFECVWRTLVVSTAEGF